MAPLRKGVEQGEGVGLVADRVKRGNGARVV
jgi:hypothetical protein